MLVTPGGQGRDAEEGAVLNVPSMPHTGQPVDRPPVIDDDRPVVQVRVTGTPAQCQRVADVLRRSLEVDRVSEPVDLQSGLVNIFIGVYTRRRRRTVDPAALRALDQGAGQ